MTSEQHLRVAVYRVAKKPAAPDDQMTGMNRPISMRSRLFMGLQLFISR